MALPGWNKLLGLVRRREVTLEVSDSLLPTANSSTPVPSEPNSSDESTPFLPKRPSRSKLTKAHQTSDAEVRGRTPFTSYDSTVTLINSPSSSSLLSSSSSLYEESEPASWAEYRTEAKILSRLTLPVVFTYLLQSSINMASVFSLGHLGANELAASALASMFASVTGWAVGIGLVTALDTLCSQSYTGARDVYAVGTYLQRGIVVITACHIPILLIWWNSEALLLALNQDPVIASLAGTYLRYLMLGCLPNLLFECVKRYLQAQGIMHASTLVLCIVAPLNMLTNYALVWYEPIALGFVGAPLATSITYWLMFILLVLYTAYVDGYQAWGGWSRQGFRKLGQFLRLGLPGVLMICAEWWAFEYVSLTVSYFGNTSLAAQSVIMTTTSLTFQIPQGIGVVITTRVGNLLGAARARAARMSSALAIVFALALGLTNSLFFLTAAGWWGRVFTSAPEVVEMVASLMKVAALFQVCDGLATVTGGILRGQGKQKLGAMLNIPAYYVLAIPAGLFLGFRMEYGVYGIWAGLCIGIFSVCFGQFYFYLRTDWEEEVAKCRKRVGADDHEYLSTTHV
ncbi:ethionine resistance protein [Dimargaris cristalligena]|uniref:Mate-domain-containing protein n=1 Tax=Dimargaris cristalligena TaxID=215637 RepID=A0A4Q0A361_9FUNG|nr:ethionine resistance protein [Dimargaris cristalligena]RKP39680.1 mate-domain-containing protein [Dimargaris cristalligena]|eukprot:RKP39680.1 mate-domain-containing protein [Dimargaris cristalligena]